MDKKENLDHKNKIDQLRQEIKVAMGQEPADQYIFNINIVDVYTETIFPGSLLIKNGKIVSVNPGFEVVAKSTFDGQGLYAVPGFIDPYYHIDFSFVMPDALSEAIVPFGTTTVVSETPDFGSAFGTCSSAVQGIKSFYRDIDRLPYRLLPLSTGKAVAAGVNEELLQWEKMFGQGEVQGFTVLNLDEYSLSKLINAREKQIYLCGHVDAFVDTDGINAFVTAGNVNDHEACTYDAVFDRLRRGNTCMIRISGGRVDNIIPEVLAHHLPTENLLFGTDNMLIDDLVKLGHFDTLIRKAIGFGMDPIAAIKMATYNPAKVLRLDHLIGSLTPGRYADIVLLNNLKDIKPVYVFREGKLIAEKGKLIGTHKVDYSDLRFEVKPGLEGFSSSDLLQPASQDQLSEDGQTALIKVLDVNTGQQFDAWLPIRNGYISAIPEEDILHAVIVDRYSSDQKRKVSTAFVRGFGLTNECAIAMNILQNYLEPEKLGQEKQRILAVGTDADNIYHALREVDQRLGAIAVASKGQKNEVLPLPYAGCVSDLSSREAAKVFEAMNDIMNGTDKKGGERVLKFFPVGALEHFGIKPFTRYI